MNRRTVRYAFYKSIPVLAGYVVLGIGFGILMRNAGYGLAWTAAMSIFIFAGSMQYVMVGLLTGGASLLTTAITTLMVNARHLFYGISMISRYKETGKKKPLLIFCLTDETYSLVCRDFPEETDVQKYYLGVSLLNYFYWNLGTVIGAVVGSLITFNTAGIEFSMTALFVSVVVEQWLTAKNHLPALCGFAASILALVLFGPSDFLIPAMIMIALSLLGSRSYNEKKEEAK